MGAKTVSAKGDHHQDFTFCVPFSPWKICLTEIFSKKYSEEKQISGNNVMNVVFS